MFDCAGVWSTKYWIRAWILKCNSMGTTKTQTNKHHIRSFFDAMCNESMIADGQSQIWCRRGMTKNGAKTMKFTTFCIVYSSFVEYIVDLVCGIISIKHFQIWSKSKARKCYDNIISWREYQRIFIVNRSNSKLLWSINKVSMLKCLYSINKIDSSVKSNTRRRWTNSFFIDRKKRKENQTHFIDRLGCVHDRFI